MARGSLSRAFLDFIRTESAGGLVLLVAAVIALTAANSPLADGYASFWTRDLGLHIGHVGDIRGLVNDGLMTVFFLVVGLEIKRELVTGELRGLERAALPVMAAVGGMVVPAFIFAVINPVGEAARGWGIPTATDIAFALGVLALLGSRVPQGLKVFLLALAIADDVGAIVLIAFFYSSGIELGWLLAAAALCGAIALSRGSAASWTLYLAGGTLLWAALSMSGIHPTIAGVILAALVPAGHEDDEIEPSERLEEVLHPVATFVIVPLFALANAGITLGGSSLSESAEAGVAVGITLGLIGGKLIGITGAALLAIRFRLATVPEGVTTRHLIGGAAVAGIGFTVSLFITELAFTDAELVHAAKIGVFAGSVGAALLGSLILGTGRPVHERVLRVDD